MATSYAPEVLFDALGKQLQALPGRKDEHGAERHTMQGHPAMVDNAGIFKRAVVQGKVTVTGRSIPAGSVQAVSFC